MPLTDMLPASCCNRSRIAIEGAEYQEDQDFPIANAAAITPDFFATFGTSVLRGRDFGLSDDAEAARVVIVNQGFADRFFPGEDPIARRMRLGTSDSQDEWKTIVGVVPNMQMEGFDPDRTDPSGFYLPLAQQDRRFMDQCATRPDFLYDSKHTVIYVDGNVYFSGGSMNNATQTPGQLQLYSTGATVSLSGQFSYMNFQASVAGLSPLPSHTYGATLGLRIQDVPIRNLFLSLEVTYLSGSDRALQYEQEISSTTSNAPKAGSA